MIAHAQPAAAAAESTWRERVEGPLVFLGAFALVALVAGNAGGFRPTTWGWTALVTLWAAALALLLRRRVALRRLDLLYLGGLGAFTCWVALSNLWTASVTSTMQEVLRDVAYLGVATAAVLLVRRRTVPNLLGGLLAAITVLCLYAATRLFPARFEYFESQSFG